jgi:hypothetical protein
MPIIAMAPDLKADDRPEHLDTRLRGAEQIYILMFII